MIISASRRTDIPAFYSEWLMNRVRAGWCLVPNPFNMGQVSRLSLLPADVDAFAFWSKNPAPMLTSLLELDDLGHRYYFLYTLNAYPAALEPSLPSLETRLDTFLALSRRLGPERVVWRYDPIIISNVTTPDYHREEFSMLASRLRGATKRVVISFVDFYGKTDRRLSSLEAEGFVFSREALNSPTFSGLLKDVAGEAHENGMEMVSCAEEKDFSEAGVVPGRCIDERLINRLWGLNLSYQKDNGQRLPCMCTASRDIGVNDTCIHGCPYCYATRNNSVAQRRHGEHDPGSPMLWASPEMLAKMATIDHTVQSRLL